MKTEIRIIILLLVTKLRNWHGHEQNHDTHGIGSRAAAANLSYIYSKYFSIWKTTFDCFVIFVDTQNTSQLQ